MKPVFVLTREHNLYDQQGEYFVAVFTHKPTERQLVPILEQDGQLFGHHVDEVAAKLVADGGGRIDKEDCWYSLEPILPLN